MMSCMPTKQTNKQKFCRKIDLSKPTTPANAKGINSIAFNTTTINDCISQKLSLSLHSLRHLNREDKLLMQLTFVPSLSSLLLSSRHCHQPHRRHHCRCVRAHVTTKPAPRGIIQMKNIKNYKYLMSLFNFVVALIFVGNHHQHQIVPLCGVPQSSWSSVSSVYCLIVTFSVFVFLQFVRWLIRVLFTSFQFDRVVFC